MGVGALGSAARDVEPVRLSVPGRADTGAPNDHPRATCDLPPEATVGADSGASIDGDLAVALLSLPDQQRLAVLMVHVYGWTPIEVGRITGTPAVTVRSHLRRGLRHLRTSLSKGNTP